MRGVDFPKLPQHPTPGDTHDQDAPLSDAKPAPSELPTRTTTTVTPDNRPLLTIEEYLHANPTPHRNLIRGRLSCTRRQILAYNRRLDACHRVLFACLNRDLCAFNMGMRYEGGQIFKGKILATLIIHVRTGAKHPWATIKRKIEQGFEGLAEEFEDGWELMHVDFVVR